MSFVVHSSCFPTTFAITLFLKYWPRKKKKKTVCDIIQFWFCNKIKSFYYCVMRLAKITLCHSFHKPTHSLIRLIFSIIYDEVSNKVKVILWHIIAFTKLATPPPPRHPFYSSLFFYFFIFYQNQIEVSKKDIARTFYTFFPPLEIISIAKFLK